MNYDAVLFDLDGTLLDTIEDLTASMNVALTQLGAAARTVDECKQFIGDGVEFFARRALPDDRRDAETVDECVAKMRAHYARHWADRTRPYDGVGELLDGLAGRGVRSTILSNKPHDFTCLMVDELLDAARFEVVLGARDDVAKKPDPAGAVEIAERLDVPPGRFLYLGDTNTDMQTAVAAGMHPVGALWGFRSRRELADNGAAALIDRPVELLDLL